MQDAGNDITEKMLRDLEKELKRVYARAVKEMTDKVSKSLAKYQEELDKKLDDLKSGEIDRGDFEKWKMEKSRQLGIKSDLLDSLTLDLVNIDSIAAAMINGHSIDVYTVNRNFGSFQVDGTTGLYGSFSLYNHQAVERIIKDDPELLPHIEIDGVKDTRWNRNHVNNAIVQGILQGESIPGIAKRLGEAAEMDRKSAVRNARTATTCAQASGRVDAYKAAERYGIGIKKRWVATLDDRTRHSHRLMDGVTIDLDDYFENKCKYPGDPQAPPDQVYNCRCTLVPIIKGREDKDSWKWDVIDYDSWKNEHYQQDEGAAKVVANKSYSDVSNVVGTDAFSEELFEKYKMCELESDEMQRIDDVITKNIDSLQSEPDSELRNEKWDRLILDDDLKLRKKLVEYLLKNHADDWKAYIEAWAKGLVQDSRIDKIIFG